MPTKRHVPYLLALHRHRPLAMWLLLLFVILIAILNSTRLTPSFQWIWVWTLVLVTVSLMIIGGAVNGRLEGVLIDSRNRVSLSKFQMVLWTIVVISALITGAALNLFHKVADPLKVVLPTELLFAMGISAGSFVATPTLLGMKADQATSTASLEATSERLNLSADETSATGRVFKLTSPQLASWTDMFRGDDVANAASADLSKVQQFAITLLLIGVYCADLWAAFAGKTFPKMPLLSPSFVMLMGISHASYLAYKAAPHGSPKTEDDGRDPRLNAVG